MASEEENKDLKEGQEEPSGDGQPENENQQEEAGDTITVEFEDEGEVELSAKEIKSLKKDRDNYREGLLKRKKKDVELPDPEDLSEGEGDDSEDFNRKLKQNNQDNAITIVTKEHPELTENWSEVMEYYDPSNVDGIKTSEYVSELERAFGSWKEENSGANPEGSDTDNPQDPKKAKAQASRDTSVNTGNPKGAGERQQEENESGSEGDRNILPTSESDMDEWYEN